MSKPTLEHIFAKVQEEHEEMHGTSEPCYTLDSYPVTPEEMADPNCGLPAFAKQYIEFYEAMFRENEHYVPPAYRVIEVGEDETDDEGVHAVIPSKFNEGKYLRVIQDREIQWTDISIISMTARLLTRNDLVAIANTPLDPTMLSQLSVIRNTGISRILSPHADEQEAELNRKRSQKVSQS